MEAQNETKTLPDQSRAVENVSVSKSGKILLSDGVGSVHVTKPGGAVLVCGAFQPDNYPVSSEVYEISYRIVPPLDQPIEYPIQTVKGKCLFGSTFSNFEIPVGIPAS